MEVRKLIIYTIGLGSGVSNLIGHLFKPFYNTSLKHYSDYKGIFQEKIVILNLLYALIAEWFSIVDSLGFLQQWQYFSISGSAKHQGAIPKYLQLIFLSGSD